MDDKKCAPSKKYKDGSCFTIDSLIKMVNSYNKNNPDNIIDIKHDRKYLLKQLTSRLENVCRDQLCWIRQDFVKNLKDDDILYNTFLPKGPFGTTWLNTTNINNVMNQYEKVYPDFKFFGAVPIDFDDLPELGIRDINFDDLYEQGKYQLGFVFNLDKHWQDGSHWVALYANIKDPQVYFFDSYGHPPRKRIRILMKKICNWCSNYHLKEDFEPTENSILNGGNKIIVEYNKKQHQFKNSECGVYSISFILRLLKGESFSHVSNNPTPDDEINKCRNYYFRR